MELTIEIPVYEALLQAARTAAPLEACGLCSGRDGRISRFFELTNADASPEHYRMLPEEQFAAVKAMRSEGLIMLGIWHSHPATPARLSEEDLRLAYTRDTVYLILSLADPVHPALRGFRVRDGQPHPVTISLATR